MAQKSIHTACSSKYSIQINTVANTAYEYMAQKLEQALSHAWLEQATRNATQ